MAHSQNTDSGLEHEEKLRSLSASSESSTIDSLIDQNDELLSRLRASQKKCAEFERRMRESVYSNQENENKIEALCDQILILKEKDRLLKDRAKEFAEKNQELTSQLEFQETRYSELSKKNQQNQQGYENTAISLSTKLGRALRYRHWVKEHLYTEYRSQKRKLAELKATLKDLHQHLYNSDSQCRSYQDQIENLKQSLEEQSQIYLKTEQSIDDLNAKYLKLKDERTVHQNRVVAAERLVEDLKTRHEAELNEWKDATSKYRQEAKSLNLSNEDLKESARNIQEEIVQLKKQNERLRDQNESLQLIWSNKKEKVERLTAKESAMQKLNQELSIQLKSARDELTQLKTKLSSASELSSQRFREMQSELKHLKQEAPQTPDQNQQSAERIEFLLAEIQSGYSKASLKGELSEHNFIEKAELMTEEGEVLL